MLYRPRSKWTWMYFSSILVNGVVALALESYVFASIQTNDKGGPSTSSLIRAIPTFLILLAFGFAYQLLLLYDTLAQANTIQLFSLCFYDAFLCVYTSLQAAAIGTIFERLSLLEDVSLQIWFRIKYMLLAIAAMTGLFTILTCLISWKLYAEFAWALYKYVIADLALKRRYLIFQCYIALLKFDLFFFVGFLVQMVVLAEKKDAEWLVTICMIPLSTFSLMAGSFVTRRENYYGSCAVMTLHLALLGFYIFKLSRTYSLSHEYTYIDARDILTYFAAVTVLMGIVTIVAQIICIGNFGKGLKPYVAGDRRAQELTDLYEQGFQVHEDGTYGFGMTAIEERAHSTHSA